MPLEFQTFRQELNSHLAGALIDADKIQVAFSEKRELFANPTADVCAMNAIMAAIFSLPLFATDFINSFKLQQSHLEYAVSDNVALVQIIILFCVLSYYRALINGTRCDISRYVRTLVNMGNISVRMCDDKGLIFHFFPPSPLPN